MKKYLQCSLIGFVLFCFASWSFAAGGQTASGKTVNELITEVRYVLKESSSAVGKMWSDTELTSYINDAIRNIVARTHCLETGSTRHVVSSGTSEYAIGSNYIFVKGVIHQSGITAYKMLKRGKQLDLGHASGEEPQAFYEFNGKVGIYPLKDTTKYTSTGTTIYVITVPKPDTLSGVSSISTPSIFDRAVILYTVSQALLKYPPMEASKWYWEQYNSELDRFRIDILDWEQSIWDVFYPRTRMNVSPQPSQ